MSNWNLNLQDRTAVVTGAGQGIGFATFQAMLDAGMNVVGGDLVVDELRPVADAAAARGLSVEVDLSQPDGPAALVSRAVDAYGGVGVLVNNAAVIGDEVAFADLTDEQWDVSVQINLMAAIRASRAVLPFMVRAGRGAIITVGSDAGELSHPGFAPYAVSKAALMNLSKLLSKEYGEHGIRSNLVAPGLTRTHATRGLLESLTEEHGSEADGVAAFTAGLGMALPRFGTAAEVASLILYLASDLAAQITGTVIRIDGGAVPTA